MTRADNRWKLVPVEPDGAMTRAFAVEIRRQAARLDPMSTAHEPLSPLWAAVLAAAPVVPPQPMPRTAAEGWNAAIGQMVVLATSAADVLRDRLAERPTRFNHAIAALDALAEIGAEFVVPLPPDEPEVAASAMPKPRAPTGDASVHEVSAA